MMDHDEILSRLDALLEGELPEGDRREVELHLAACLPCSRELASLADLVARARSLPEGVPPGNDLWPGILGRLAAPAAAPPEPVSPLPRPKGRRFPVLIWRPALAAAAAAAVLVGAALLFPPGRRTARLGPPLPTGDPRESMVVVSGEGKRQSGEVAQLIWGLEKESAGLGESVLAGLDQDPGPLGAEGVEKIRAGLASLDRAIDDAVTALKEDPGDPELIQRVTGYYRRRIALLEEAARAASISA